MSSNENLIMSSPEESINLLKNEVKTINPSMSKFVNLVFKPIVIFILFIFSIYIFSEINYKNNTLHSNFQKATKMSTWSFNPSTSINPGKDFYAYVNQKWLDSNPMPDDYTRYGSFELLHISNQQKIKNILENEEHKDELPVIIYQNGMNEQKIEQQKYIAIDSILQELQKADNKNEIFRIGVINRGRRYLKTLFNIYTEGDKKDSNNNIIYMSQSGLGLPDRDYYLEDSKKDDLAAYKNYINEIFELLNIQTSSEISSDISQDIINFETEIAKISLSKIEQRDPEKTYNIKETHEDIKLMAPNFDWDNYFNGIKKGKISVSSPNFMSKLSELWGNTNIEILRKYFILRTIASASSYMNQQAYDIYFKLYGTILRGQKEPKPRWKRVLSSVEDDLGEPLGRIYSELYFTEASKEKALNMIECIRKVLSKKIDSVEWLANETKEKAQKKLASFKVKIGYPNKWKDLSSINVNVPTYYEQLVEASKFSFDYDLAQAYDPVDKGKWYMNAHDVNAYYHPIMNEIVFPAGILQEPFFSYDYSDAENFGGIGSVIAHEMTHGFDDQGRLYNDQGMMGNWWTDQDIKNYQERTKLIDEQFSGFKLYGEPVQGKLTMGENIADIGGIKLAFYGLNDKILQSGGQQGDIYKAKDVESSNYQEKFSPAELIFMSWARVWCAHITKEETLKRLAIDPHSPNYYRVNGILGNIKEFFTAYNLGNDVEMRPKGGMAEIW